MPTASKKFENTSIIPVEIKLDACSFKDLISHLLKIADQTGAIGRRMTNDLFDSSRLEHGPAIGGLRHSPTAADPAECAVRQRLAMACVEFDRAVRLVIGRPMPEHAAE